ncbi:MAG: hypothetical protein MZV64_04960 [Ignavibacteriales bacterium]|nr:hypothetical protein [Ignavibacteriales bacterium]
MFTFGACPRAAGAAAVGSAGGWACWAFTPGAGMPARRASGVCSQRRARARSACARSRRFLQSGPRCRTMLILRHRPTPASQRCRSSEPR